MPIKRRNAKIQIGTIMLDCEIELEEKPLIDDPLAFAWAYMKKYPTWGPDKIVDGSLVQPITDPARLIESD